MWNHLAALILTVVLFTGFSREAMAVDHHEFKLGDMEIIALADVPKKANPANRPELLIGLSDADAKAMLTPGAMDNSINCFVVKMGRDVLLFDTGLGGEMGETVKSLAAAGLKPSDVTAVIITHFHPDHVGGLVNAEGEAVFPESRLMVPRLEIEANASAAMKFLPAYAGRLHTFEWDHAASDGVLALEAAGHTPGHTVFMLESGKQKLLILGDLIHFATIQLPRPDVAVTYDADPQKAIAARKRIFDQAAQDGVLVAGMHLPFPGVGKLGKDGSGYTFTPEK